MIVSRGKRIILWALWLNWHITPYFFIDLFLFFIALWFNLLYLFPIELDTVNLYFFDDFVGDLTRDIRRLAISSQLITIAIDLLFGLFSFCCFLLFLYLNLTFICPLTKGSTRISSLNKRTQIIHWDVKLNLRKCSLRLPLRTHR